MQFETGEVVPEGAVFLSSVANELVNADNMEGDLFAIRNDQRRAVHHFFLVDAAFEKPEQK